MKHSWEPGISESSKILICVMVPTDPPVNAVWSRARMPKLFCNKKLVYLFFKDRVILMWFSYHPSPLNQEGEFKGTIEMVKPQGKQPTFPTACDQHSLLREEDHKILVSQSVWTCRPRALSIPAVPIREEERKSGLDKTLVDFIEEI